MRMFYPISCGSFQANHSDQIENTGNGKTFFFIPTSLKQDYKSNPGTGAQTGNGRTKTDRTFQEELRDQDRSCTVRNQPKQCSQKRLEDSPAKQGFRE